MRSFNLPGVFSGFVGGLVGAHLLAYLAPVSTGVPQRVAATATQNRVVAAERIQLIDATGRARVELAMSSDGGPGIFFYDSKGRNRLELGLYSPAESEYPFVVLNDGQQRAAGIFRLFGARETPVVVLKHEGRDRSIYGLNPGSTEPFLVNYSGDARKISVFGAF